MTISPIFLKGRNMKDKEIALGLMVLALATINIAILPNVLIILAIFAVFLSKKDIEVVAIADEEQCDEAYIEGLRVALAAENEADNKLHHQIYDGAHVLCLKHENVFYPVYVVHERTLHEYQSN